MSLTFDNKRIVSPLLLMILLFLIISPVWAQHYGKASNVAGVWKMTVTPGMHLVSFPLLPTDKSLDNVLGDQFPGGTSWEEATRIVTYFENETVGSYYSSTDNEWIGTLDELDLRRGYWLIVPNTTAAVNLTLVGAAMDADTMDMGLITPGMNIVSAGYPFSSTLGGSGLVTSGHSSASYKVTSDRVYKWEAGNLDPSWHNQQNGWQGNWQNLDPGHGYVIIVVNANGGYHWRMPRPDEVATNQVYNNSPGSAGYQTIPTPDFNKPPWGNNPVPGRGKK